MGPGRGKFHQAILQSGLKMKICMAVLDRGVSCRVYGIWAIKNMSRYSLIRIYFGVQQLMWDNLPMTVHAKSSSQVSGSNRTIRIMLNSILASGIIGIRGTYHKEVKAQVVIKDTHIFRITRYRLIWQRHYWGVPDVKLRCPEIGGSNPFIWWMHLY